MNTASIELLILDVDGVLTDGSVWSVSDGGTTKGFNVHDGSAIKLWQRCGGKVAIVSGRTEEVVTRRAAELGIEWVHTGVTDKLVAYEAVVSAAKCGDAGTGYVGDDFPDLPPMGRCAFPVAVANATPAVKRAALYVTRHSGGAGAVAEIVELLLRKRNQWDRTKAR